MIDHWKVQKITKGRKIVDYYVNKKSRLIEINCSSKKHEEMRKIFNQHGMSNRDFNGKRAEKAQEFIRGRYSF